MNLPTIRLLLPLLLCLLFLSGCGNKGPVKPLRLPLPSSADALDLRQVGDRVLVAWNIPRTNQDGSELTDLQGFKVYKMKYDLAEDCPECRDTSLLLRKIDLDYLQEARRVGNRIYLADAELEEGVGYQYRVVPYTSRGRDGAPTQKRHPFVAPPPSPTFVGVSEHDRLVRLRWLPVADPRQGIEILGYNLYRGEAGSPLPMQPINHELLTETNYQDFGLKNDTAYVYTLRSVARIFDMLVESASAEAVNATPRAGQ